MDSYINNTPLVSVIVLNYNGKKFLHECFASLKNQTYDNLEIIMVDNNSSDDSIDYTKENFPSIIVIKNNKNLGFAAGNNVGMRVARGNYFFVLNNDTKIDSGCIKNLVENTEKDKNIGMCAPKIVSIYNPKLIDSVGLNIYPDGLARGMGRNEIDIGQFDKNQESLMPSACAALYRKKMLNEVGLFDETFFAYCEDSDLGIRARLAGWKSSAAPRAIVYHHYSGTFGKYSETKAFLAERNHFFVAIKNFPIKLILLLPAYTAVRYASIIYGIIKKRGPAAKFQASKLTLVITLIKAYFSLITSLPYLIKERKKIQKNKKLSSKDFLSLVKKYQLGVSKITLQD